MTEQPASSGKQSGRSRWAARALSAAVAAGAIAGLTHLLRRVRQRGTRSPAGNVNGRPQTPGLQGLPATGNLPLRS